MNIRSNLLKKPIIRNTMAQQKQEIWRRKQINIFYRYGRPLFNINYVLFYISTLYLICFFVIIK